MSFPKINQYTLENNIKLLIIPVNNVKTVSVSVTLDCGYFEENQSETGIAHLLEHMIARYLKDGPLMKKINSKGILVYTNASTSPFRTSYYAYGDSEYYKEILELILQTYIYRQVDSSLFNSEKNSVVVEMKKKMINKENIGLYQELPKMMFGKNTKVKSDFRRHIDVVSESKENDLIKFMKKHYLPGITTVTISGKFDKKICIKIIKEKLNRFKKTPQIQKRIIKQDKSGIFPKVKIINDLSRTVTKLYLSFKIFNTYNYKKKYSAKLLCSILSRIGDKSILFKRLRSNLGVTYSPHAITSFNPYYGTFTFSMNIESSNIEKCLMELSTIIIDLKKSFINDTLIRLAKSRAELDIKNDIYNNNPQKYLKYTDKIINNEEVLNPSQIFNKYYKLLSKKDLQETSKTMFKKNNCYLLLVGKSRLSVPNLRELINI